MRGAPVSTPSLAPEALASRARWRPARGGRPRHPPMPSKRPRIPSAYAAASGVSAYADVMEPSLAITEAAAGSDPDAGLRAVAALRALTERLEILQVDNARRLGWSWQALAVTAMTAGLVPPILSALGTSAPELRTAILEHSRQPA